MNFFIIIITSIFSGVIAILIWEAFLRREFQPSSNKRLLAFQEQVFAKLRELCGSELHVELGDPHSGYDFVVVRQNAPEVIVETKSKDTWKYPTTKVVGQTIRRLERALCDTSANKAIIVIEGGGHCPFGELPRNIRICSLDQIKQYVTDGVEPNNLRREAQQPAQADG